MYCSGSVLIFRELYGRFLFFFMFSSVGCKNCLVSGAPPLGFVIRWLSHTFCHGIHHHPKATTIERNIVCKLFPKHRTSKSTVPSKGWVFARDLLVFLNRMIFSRVIYPGPPRSIADPPWAGDRAGNPSKASHTSWWTMKDSSCRIRSNTLESSKDPFLVNHGRS